MTGIVVLIFAKYPQPGRVKTRMVPPLTPEQAALLHSASLRAVCALVRRVTENAVLVVTPDDSMAAFGDLVGGFPSIVRPQGGGDLGDRLDRAARWALDAGADGVILLGADSPTLPAKYLRDALRLVPGHDVVMGPCDDGGYYSLGLRKPASELFDGIDWGTSRVAAQTRARAESAGLKLVELPSWYDLDHYENLSRAAQDLGVAGRDSPAATAALRDLIAVLLKEEEHE